MDAPGEQNEEEEAKVVKGSCQWGMLRELRYLSGTQMVCLSYARRP